jgi:polyhydroxyalkanoate synthesis regulator phasin
MNTVEYYNRQKELWSDTELQEIRTEYQDKEMTISEMGNIHRRTPGSISYKLKNLGLITNNNQARGYDEYKNSDLYKEIVKKGKINDSEKKMKLISQYQTTSVTPQININFKELVDLRSDVEILKTDLKEILRLMNVIYNFKQHSS